MKYVTKEDSLREYIIGRAKILKKSNGYLAKKLGLKSRQAYAYKLSTLTFGYLEYIDLFRELETTEAELTKLFL